MTLRAGRSLSIVVGLATVMTLGVAALASAQEKPRHGGELIFVVVYLNNHLDTVWLSE